MKTSEFAVDTDGRRVLDLTERVRAFAAEAGGDGLLHVFLPHATAGLALMETGSGSEDDLEEVLDRLLPRDDRYRHRHGATGHGGTISCRRSFPPRSRFRWRAAGQCSGPGSRSSSSTRTATTTSVVCD